MVGVSVAAIAVVALNGPPSQQVASASETLRTAHPAGSTTSKPSPSSSARSSHGPAGSATASSSGSSSSELDRLERRLDRIERRLGGKLPVIVLNNTSATPGSVAADRFRQAGWTVSDVSTFTGDILSTAAYYDPNVAGAQFGRNRAAAGIPRNSQGKAQVRRPARGTYRGGADQRLQLGSHAQLNSSHPEGQRDRPVEAPATTATTLDAALTQLGDQPGSVTPRRVRLQCSTGGRVREEGANSGPANRLGKMRRKGLDFHDRNTEHPARADQPGALPPAWSAATAGPATRSAPSTPASSASAHSRSATTPTGWRRSPGSASRPARSRSGGTPACCRPVRHPPPGWIPAPA